MFSGPLRGFFLGGKGEDGDWNTEKNSHFFLPSHVVTAFLSRSVEIESYSSCKPSFLSPNSTPPWDHPPPSRLVQFFFWPNNIKAKPNNNSTQSSLEGGEREEGTL